MKNKLLFDTKIKIYLKEIPEGRYSIRIYQEVHETTKQKFFLCRFNSDQVIGKNFLDSDIPFELIVRKNENIEEFIATNTPSFSPSFKGDLNNEFTAVDAILIIRKNFYSIIDRKIIVLDYNVI